MEWKILDTGLGSAQENMAIDRKLFEKMDPNGPPILHFYDWKAKTATYGHFLRPNRFLNLEGAAALGLSLARRPTGGGITFHLSDFAFSALVPARCPHYSTNTLDNYNFINSAVKRGVQTFFDTQQRPHLLPEEPSPFDASCRHFCMAQPTKYDVVLNGRKIAGAAQRQSKRGYLHQGSIALALPPIELLDAVLLKGTEVYRAMQVYTYPLLGASSAPSDLREARSILQHQLHKELTK